MTSISHLFSLFWKLFCQKCLNVLDFVEQHFVGHLCFYLIFFFFRRIFKKISNFVKIFKSFGFCRAAFLSATSLSAPGVVYQGSHFMFYNPTNYKQYFNLFFFFIFYVLQPNKLQTIIQSAFGFFMFYNPTNYKQYFNLLFGFFMFYNPTNYKQYFNLLFWIFYVLHPNKLQTIFWSVFFTFYVLQPNKLQTIF